MNNENINLIKTGLYSKPAYDIIEAVFGQLSDGWGQNARSLKGWWKFARVRQADDGEVIVTIVDNGSAYTKNRWKDLESVSARKKQIATWIKKTIYMEITDRTNNSTRAIEWKRDNTKFRSFYLNRSDDITIQDIYLVVDVLLEKFKSNNYSPEAVERIFSKKLSEEESAKLIAKRDKKSACIAEYQADIRALEAEKAKLIAEIEAKYSKLLRARYEKRGADINLIDLAD